MKARIEHEGTVESDMSFAKWWVIGRKQWLSVLLEGEPGVPTQLASSRSVLHIDLAGLDHPCMCDRAAYVVDDMANAGHLTRHSSAGAVEPDESSYCRQHVR